MLRGQHISLNDISREYCSFVANSQLGSPSIAIIPRSFETHNSATSSRSRYDSELSNIPPCMIPDMHSYSKDIAGVVCIRLVNGGSSFLIRRGSSGVIVANYSLSAFALDLSQRLTCKLDNLNSHPVISTTNKQIEQSRCKRQKVFWSPPA